MRGSVGSRCGSGQARSPWRPLVAAGAGPDADGVRGRSVFVFTNRLGCLGSLLLSAVLTLLLYAVLRLL
jgi:hypothetical protein